MESLRRPGREGEGGEGWKTLDLPFTTRPEFFFTHRLTASVEDLAEWPGELRATESISKQLRHRSLLKVLLSKEGGC